MTSASLRTWIHAHGARYLAFTLCFISGVSLWIELSHNPLPMDITHQNPATKIFSDRVALIPLGILIVTFARTVIGIQTIGIFIPVLLAVTISKVGIPHSMILLLLVLLSGLALSFSLRSFKILPMPRTASMIVIVVLIIQGYQYLSRKLGLDTEHLFNAFPLIVLAWMVERLADLIDTQSVKDGILRFIGSLSVSLACWAIFHINYLLFFLNNYLEVHFIALGLMILLGTYTGLTLNEWVSYSALSRYKSPTISAATDGGPSHDHTVNSESNPPQD